MIQLFIDGQEVDIDQTTAFPVTKQFEDLTNPTVVKNGFTKTVKLPATSRNNELFNHIYRLDQLNFSFDPLERVPFALTWNGNLLESGYIKLGEIVYNGRLPQSYEITMYGGLFDFFYELSEKTLDQLGGEPAHAGFRTNYAHTITAAEVVRSWDNEYYKYILSYSGDYDNFDKGATIESVISFPMQGLIYSTYRNKFVGTGKNIAYISEDGLTWEKHEQAYPMSKCAERDSGIFAIEDTETYTNTYYYSTDGVTWQSAPYTNEVNYSLRAYNIRTVGGFVYVFGTNGGQATAKILYGSMLPGTCNFTFNGSAPNALVSAVRHIHQQYSGFVVAFYNSRTIGYGRDGEGSSLDDPDYNLIELWLTGTITDMVCNNKSYSTTVLCGEGTYTLYYMTNDPTNWTQATVTGDVVTGSVFKRIEYVGGKFIAVGDSGVIAVSHDDGETFTVYRPYKNSNPVYYGVAYYDGLYVVTGSTVLAYSTDAVNWNYIRGEEVEIDEDVDEHQRNEFRSYYQRPCLRLKHIFNQICAESDYTVELDADFFTGNNPYWEKTWLMMNRLSVPENELSQTNRGNVRSNDRITYDVMMTKGISQADFLVNFCKVFGLVVERDELRKVVTIRSRNAFFRDYRLLDWTEKIDYSKNYTLSALTFDSRYIRMGWETSGTQYEIDYEEKYSNEYGKVRRDTAYKFNKDEKELVEGSVLRNIVVSQDYDYYFEGRKDGQPYRDDKILPAVYTKSNNERDQVETSLVLLFDSGRQTLREAARISDDASEMLQNGNYTWNDLSASPQSSIPLMTRLYTAGSSVYSLDFAVPKEYYYDITSYPEAATLYDRFWKSYIGQRHDVNTRVMKAYVHLTPGDMAGFRFNTFVKIENTLWHVNKVMDYNAMDDKTTQVELVRVMDLGAYVEGQKL